MDHSQLIFGPTFDTEREDGWTAQTRTAGGRWGKRQEEMDFGLSLGGAGLEDEAGGGRWQGDTGKTANSKRPFFLKHNK